MTEKLYYQNPYQKTFEAQVLSCEEKNGTFLIELDRTAFYPEGGGQPGDKGLMENVPVTDVHEKGGIILHTCTSPLSPGSTVHCSIDWQRRFDHMQQHSGEHIVSGMLCSSFRCDNVGFHMGEETVTIDYNTEISWEDLLGIEEKANAYIWEGHELSEKFYSGESLVDVEYRSKKALEGEVRIISFPGADTCACCGTHVKNSSEVGLVKFISCIRFRDGVRIELVCGGRAMKLFSESFTQNRRISQLLSVKPKGTAAAVENLKNELASSYARVSGLESLHFFSVAAGYAGAGKVLHFEDGLSSDSLRKLADTISLSCGGPVLVVSDQKYAVIYKDHDIRDFVKTLNARLNGRGGGRDGFAQGSLAADREAIQSFWEENGLS